MNAYLQYLKDWTNEQLLFAYRAYTRAKLQEQRVTVFRTNAAIHPLKDRPPMKDARLHDMLEEHCKFLQDAFGGSSPSPTHATWTVKTQQDLSNYAHRQRPGEKEPVIQVTGKDLHSPTAFIDPPLPDKDDNNIIQYEAFFKAHASYVDTELYVIQCLCLPTMLPIDSAKQVRVEKQLLQDIANAKLPPIIAETIAETKLHQLACLDTFMRCLGERTLELSEPRRADILQRALTQYFPNLEERNKVWSVLELGMQIVQDILKSRHHIHAQSIADLLNRRLERAAGTDTDKYKAYQIVTAAFMSLIASGCK